MIHLRAKRAANLTVLIGKTLTDVGSNFEPAAEGVHWTKEAIAPAKTAKSPKSHKIAPSNLPFGPKWQYPNP